jgi:phosphate transport system substrate-binding protein
MKATTKQWSTQLFSMALRVGFTALFASCTQGKIQQQQSISIDESSTVYPITQAVAEEFLSTQQTPVNVTVNFSGTGGGFKKFCAGETDVNNASRPIQTDEMEACNRAGVRYIELPIAYDALTVVVNPENDWAESITLAGLEKIWEPKAMGKITHWNQVRDSWPNNPLTLYGPGSNSGTFDYFTEAVVGEVGESRSDYLASEDDDILVQGVTQDPNALGYFGYAYYESHQDDLKALAVDSGDGPVMPSRETVKNAEYQPLSRPLFIYVNVANSQNNPMLREFVEFYLEKAPETMRTVGYITLPDEGYYLAQIHFPRGKVCTVSMGSLS